MLDAVLTERGYECRTPTLVQTAAIDVVLQRLQSPPFEGTIDGEPSQVWMDCWWSVDARGGPDAQAIARRILVSHPAVYASAYDRDGVAAVGRLALVDDWGGIYCMAVRPDARRLGYGRAVLRGLLQEGMKHDTRHVWLQVTEANHTARALYQHAGFSDASRYHYRVHMSPVAEAGARMHTK